MQLHTSHKKQLGVTIDSFSSLYLIRPEVVTLIFNSFYILCIFRLIEVVVTTVNVQVLKDPKHLSQS